MAQTQPVRPPQHFAPGGRRMLDAQWLSYVSSTGDIGTGAELERNELLERGIVEFNDGRFLACHETWEALWVDAAYPERLFLLGLAKLGAGFAHALRRNPKGVQSLLADAIRFLRPFGPAYANVDIDSILANVSAWLEFPSTDAPYPTITHAANAS